MIETLIRCVIEYEFMLAIYDFWGVGWGWGGGWRLRMVEALIRCASNYEFMQAIYFSRHSNCNWTQSTHALSLHQNLVRQTLCNDCHQQGIALPCIHRHLTQVNYFCLVLLNGTVVFYTARCRTSITCRRHCISVTHLRYYSQKTFENTQRKNTPGEQGMCLPR